MFFVFSGHHSSYITTRDRTKDILRNEIVESLCYVSCHYVTNKRYARRTPDITVHFVSQYMIDVSLLFSFRMRRSCQK